MGRFVCAVGKIEEEKHVSGKTKSVAELFHGDAGTDGRKTFRLRVGEIKKSEVRKMNGADHDGQHCFQSMFCGEKSTDQTSNGQRNDANGAIKESDLTCRETQTAAITGVEQEGLDHGNALRLGK